MKYFGTILLTSLVSGAITLGAYKLLFENAVSDVPTSQLTTAVPIKNVALDYAYNTNAFTEAANKTIHTVVHVKNVSYRTTPSNPILEYFYGYKGGQMQEQIGTGSGVIISEDGYIVTNNHVIKGATQIEITLNDNRSYPAKLIGTDSKMDIALLKIDPNEKLPYTVFADSDAIKVGEWVLAVGNPYNLTSTVTAGIVSAKARNLSTTGIQSFIQTDAAVNPGNSGGALVNSNGELIGINTMISSTTGSYVGYSFAVPSNMVRKIVTDIMEFGKVQQAILGVQGFELNSQISEEQNISTGKGFYVNSVSKNSGSEKAGLKKGDVITAVEGKNISNFMDLNSIIATKRPNDFVTVDFTRNNHTQSVKVQLSPKEIAQLHFNGFEIEALNTEDKKVFGIDYGVKIKEVTNEKYVAYANELRGAIILAINGTKIEDIETAQLLLTQNRQQNRLHLDIITANKERLRLIM
ncbi:MAG TPA: trypsin-like peptidase domain-containing protein [Flavobacterium sp.]|nr:trypsin-like peptidase domain-containing protein [Flavobacterium sp.]